MTEGTKQLFTRCIAIGLAVGISAAAIIMFGTLAYAISIGVPILPR